ncbi:DUF899 domain-containing protein [Luedemannella flava]|uniref:DUF899 domain-containing protein n=1 Tax=Luedemannella flava TaxID=349316 RepID=A0ABP4Y2P2_9ACTN
MALPTVVSRDEWLTARKELLAREKQLTRARDALNTARRELPMVRIDKHYVFEGPDGPARLSDLFAGMRQLIVQHVMFGPDWDAACPSCTAGINELSDGLFNNLRNRRTRYVLVSRTPLDKIEKYRTEKGWTVPWYSSLGSDFNYDFHVTIDASVRPVMFNYRGPEELQTHGMEWLLDTANQPSEQPGLSCFLRDGDDIFHTYSTFGRGTEAGGGAYGLLDLTALGRQEEWEEPKGRVEHARRSAPDFTE